jgi:hypothetical protein
MHDQFVAFLTNPTRDSFLAIRALVAAHPNYDGYSDDFRAMEDALDRNDPAGVKDAFGRAQPNLLLSPGAHLLLSVALRSEGNEQAADVERLICFRCVEGVQLTGAGTAESPYLVLRTSDEYDLLSALDKRLASQHLVHDNGKSFDRLVCDDGSELWFDITEMMAAAARRLSG